MRIIEKLKTIAIIFLLLLAFGSYVYKSENKTILGISYNISQTEIVNNINSERAKNNLRPLALNGQLNLAAEQKASDMLKNNYWAHFSPTGITPWYFLKNSNYKYVYAGENLAKGYASASEVVSAWMASPSHKQNMLSSKFADTGVSVMQGKLLGRDVTLVVEMFGSTN